MTNAYTALRNYTKLAVDQRIANLMKRKNTVHGKIYPRKVQKGGLYKLRETRNARQKLLKIIHRHVLETMAYILNTDAEVLEEGILDKDDYVNIFSSSFAEEAKKTSYKSTDI